MSLRLIVETPTNNNDFTYVVEERNANEPRTLYIKGPYMMAEGVNRNNVYILLMKWYVKFSAMKMI